MKKSKKIISMISVFLVFVFVFQSLYTNASKIAITGQDGQGGSPATGGYSMPDIVVKRNIPVGYRFTLTTVNEDKKIKFKSASVYDTDVISQCGSDYAYNSLYTGYLSKPELRALDPINSNSFELQLKPLSKRDQARTQEWADNKCELIIPKPINSTSNLAGVIESWCKTANKVRAIEFIHKAKNGTQEVSGKFDNVVGIGGALLIEPIWPLRDSSRTYALTATEMAIFFGDEFGYKTKYINKSKRDAGKSLQFLSRMMGSQLPNALRTGNKINGWYKILKDYKVGNIEGTLWKKEDGDAPWEFGSSSADNLSLTPQNVINQGYGIGVVYSEKKPELSSSTPTVTTKSVYIRHSNELQNGLSVNGSKKLNLQSGVKLSGLNLQKNGSFAQVTVTLKYNSNNQTWSATDNISGTYGLWNVDSLMDVPDYYKMKSGQEWQGIKFGSSALVSFGHNDTSLTGKGIIESLGFNLNTILNNHVITLYPNVEPCFLTIIHKIPTHQKHEYTNVKFKTDGSGRVIYADGGGLAKGWYNAYDTNDYGLTDIETFGVNVPYYHYVSNENTPNQHFWEYKKTGVRISEWQGFNAAGFLTTVNDQDLLDKYKKSDVEVEVVAVLEENTASIDLRLKNYNASSHPKLVSGKKFSGNGYIRNGESSGPYFGSNKKYNNTITLQHLRNIFDTTDTSFTVKPETSFYASDSGIKIANGNQSTSLTVEQVLSKFGKSLKKTKSISVVIEISLDAEENKPVIVQFAVNEPFDSEVEYKNPSFKTGKGVGPDGEEVDLIYNAFDDSKYTQIIGPGQTSFSLESPAIFGVTAVGYYLKKEYTDKSGGLLFDSGSGTAIEDEVLEGLIALAVEDSSGNLVVTLYLVWKKPSLLGYDLAVESINLIDAEGKTVSKQFIHEGEFRYIEIGVRLENNFTESQVASVNYKFDLDVEIGNDKDGVRKTFSITRNIFIINPQKNESKVCKIRLCDVSCIMDNFGLNDDEFSENCYYTNGIYESLKIEDIFPNGIDNELSKDNTNCNRFYVNASISTKKYNKTQGEHNDKYNYNNDAKNFFFYYPKMPIIQTVLENRVGSNSDEVIVSTLDSIDNIIDIYSGQYVVGSLSILPGSAIATHYNMPFRSMLNIPSEIHPVNHANGIPIDPDLFDKYFAKYRGYLSYNDFTDASVQGYIKEGLPLKYAHKMKADPSGIDSVYWGTSRGGTYIDGYYNTVVANYMEVNYGGWFSDDLFYPYCISGNITLGNTDAIRKVNPDMPHYHDTSIKHATVNINKINLRTEIILEGKNKETGLWEEVGDTDVEALKYSRFRVRNMFEAITGVNYLSDEVDSFATKILADMCASVAVDNEGIVTQHNYDMEYFTSEDKLSDFNLVSASATSTCLVDETRPEKERLENTYCTYRKEFVSEEFKVNPYLSREISLYSSIFLSDIDIDEELEDREYTYEYTKDGKTISQTFLSYENAMLQYETTAPETRVDNKVAKTITLKHETLPIKSEFNGSNVYRPGTDVVTAFKTTNDSGFDYTGFYNDLGPSSAKLILRGKIPLGNDQYENIDIEKPFSSPSKGITLDWFKWHVPENAEVGSSAMFTIYLRESKIMGDPDDPDEYEIGTAAVLIGAAKRANTPDTTFTQTRNKYYDATKEFDIKNAPYSTDNPNDAGNVFFDNGAIVWNSVYWNHLYLMYKPIQYRLSFSAERADIINSLKKSSNTIKSGYGVYTDYKLNLVLDIFTYDFESEETRNINNITDDRILLDNNFYWAATTPHFTSEQNVMCFFPEFNYEANMADVSGPATIEGSNYKQYIANEYSSKIYSGRSGFNNKNNYDYINNCAYGTFATLNKNEDGYYELPINTTTLKRIHYIPIWYPDAEYKVKFVANEIWTPMGMITVQGDSNTIHVRDSEANDWFFGSQTYAK